MPTAGRVSSSLTFVPNGSQPNRRLDDLKMGEKLTDIDGPNVEVFILNKHGYPPKPNPVHDVSPGKDSLYSLSLEAVSGGYAYEYIGGYYVGRDEDIREEFKGWWKFLKDMSPHSLWAGFAKVAVEPLQRGGTSEDGRGQKHHLTPAVQDDPPLYYTVRMTNISLLANTIEDHRDRGWLLASDLRNLKYPSRYF